MSGLRLIDTGCIHSLWLKLPTSTLGRECRGGVCEACASHTQPTYRPENPFVIRGFFGLCAGLTLASSASFPPPDLDLHLLDRRPDVLGKPPVVPGPERDDARRWVGSNYRGVGR
jgi:hypothetical protein